MKPLQYLSVRRQMKKVARAMWERKLTNAAGGNFAVKVDADRFLISPSKMSEFSMCDLDVDEFLLVDHQGTILEGKGSLSRETDMHLMLLSGFNNVKCTIHAHPQYCMVYASQSKPIKTVTEATSLLGDYFGLVDPAPACSKQLAENVYRYFDERRSIAEEKSIGCILPLHGVVVSGDSLMTAFSCLEMMETDAICNIFKTFI